MPSKRQKAKKSRGKYAPAWLQEQGRPVVNLDLLSLVANGRSTAKGAEAGAALSFMRDYPV